MWPIHGHYQCRVCGRQYCVEWAEPPASQKSGRRRAVPSLRSAILPALILTVLFGRSIPSPAATAPATMQAAEAVLERFTGSQDEAVRWPLETIEIEASLPTLAKRGRMSAVRRLLPAGHPKYEVVESDGDATVRREVIVRYLSADARATELPAPSVAMTSANYKFDFVGAFSRDGRIEYAFHMTPRQKRQGLLKGIVWLDGETGMAVRQTGTLVKSPSLFLKRIDVTRENHLREGAVESRVTHVAINARLIGRAELVITERPSAPADAETADGTAGQ